MKKLISLAAVLFTLSLAVYADGYDRTKSSVPSQNIGRELGAYSAYRDGEGARASAAKTREVEEKIVKGGCPKHILAQTAM